jgi:peptide/nickel transport system permease protein
MSTSESVQQPVSGTPLWRLPLRHSLLTTGLILVGALVLAAALAPVLARHSPTEQNFDGIDADGLPMPPSAKYLLGTDSMGRDVLSRVLFGARISLLVGIFSVLMAAAIGVVIGLYAGYYGGWVDMVLMRFTDIMMAVPALLLAMCLSGLLGLGREIDVGGFHVKLERGLYSILFVVAIVSWTAIARVVRGQVLSLKERPFIEAAHALGYTSSRILWGHIFPNVIPVVLVLTALGTAGAIGLEAGLSYLGLGVPQPQPSWGTMISDGQAYLTAAPLLVLAPGLAVVLAVLGFNLIAQGLQDALDPRHSRS